MSEWNLSVRLTGEGRDLARTLRTTGRDARAASRDVNALRRDVSELRAEMRRPIRLQVGLNTGDLRTEIRNAVRDVRGMDIAVGLRLADPMQLRRDVNDAVRWASMNQTIRVRITPDTSALNGLNGTPGNLVPGAGSSAASSSAAASLKSLLLLAPAIIPLTTALAGLPGALAASATSATAFGVAIAGQIGPLSEAAEAEKAYNDAVREHGAGSLEAAQAQLAYQRQLAALPPETQKAAAGLTNLKDSYRQWTDSLSGDTMQPVVHSLALMDALLPHLTPQAQAFSRELDRAITLAGGAVATPGFDAASDRFADFTDRTLANMGDSLVHVMRLLSEGDVDGPLSGVIDYIRANGDEARETLGNLGDAVGNLFEGAAQAGPTMLSLVNAVARLVASVPPEVVGVLIQLAAALKLVQLAGLGAAAIAGGVANLGTRLAALQAASVAAGGGLAGLAAAFATLSKAAKASVIVAGIALVAISVKKLMDLGQDAPPNIDKLTTSLGKLGASGKASGEAARLFGKDLDDLYDSVRNITDPSTVDNIQNGLVKVLSLGQWDSTPWEEAREKLDGVDESLTDLVKAGKTDLAAAAFQRLSQAYVDGGGSLSDFTGQMDGYKSALADLAFEQDYAAQSMGPFGKAAQEVSATLSAQKGAVDGLRSSILALNDVNRSAYDAEIGFESALDDLTEAFKENGATLDIHTRAGQANGQAMSAAAKAQDELIASGVAAGDSFATMTSKTSALRSEMMRLAVEAFDGNTKKARAYVNTLLGTPETVTTLIKAEQEQAVRDLQAVQAEIEATPGAKKVTVTAPTASARGQLEALGFKIEDVPGTKNVTITVPTGTPIAAVNAIQSAINGMSGRSLGIGVYTTEYYKRVESGDNVPRSLRKPQAHGSVLDFYADGGMRRENHVAQFARAGAWRVWAEDETGGEAYIPLALSKRVRSRAIAEEAVRRLGGDPLGIQWNANGNVTDWRYDPTTGSLYSPSDAGAAGRKTRKVKGKEVEYFDLGAVERKLKSAASATRAWNADLEKVADRVGGDVADALASMGEEGMRLADKMAKGSTKYINEMAAALRALQKTARASLTDYTRQLTSANKVNKDFADDLARLAAMGYGDLARQLAEQNDTAAQQIADAASKDKGKAAKANAAAKAANSSLTPDQVQDLVQIIAAIRTAKTGIHDVAAATGLGEDVIIDVANKAKAQISKSLGSRAGKFLTDLNRANKHLSYADGGIRAGIYATQAGAIRFAEPETGGEAYLPLGANKRRHAMPVLADVAHRFGVGLTDGQASRTVIIREQGPLMRDVNMHVGDRRSDADLARDIEQRFAFQMRRAARGGISSRASS
ncbi:hypothetical protein [Streptomyces osmaniensis]|uniref:Uncharacterized protein n=1 Tax=Streptomyces osmaniensis TaxID=593134 RepID=A0ABP6Z4F1_9ACTN